MNSHTLQRPESTNAARERVDHAEREVERLLENAERTMRDLADAEKGRDALQEAYAEGEATVDELTIAQARVTALTGALDATKRKSEEADIRVRDARAELGESERRDVVVEEARACGECVEEITEGLTIAANTLRPLVRAVAAEIRRYIEARRFVAQQGEGFRSVLEGAGVDMATLQHDLLGRDSHLYAWLGNYARLNLDDPLHRVVFDLAMLEINGPTPPVDAIFTGPEHTSTMELIARTTGATDAAR